MKKAMYRIVCIICYYLCLRKNGDKNRYVFFNVPLKDIDDMSDSEEGKLELGT